jgi:polar amino acid transport system substrate-binding protein
MVETLHLPKDSKIQIALIGAGGFAKTTLLPIISNLQTVNLNTVVDKNILSAINVAENYNFANKDTDPSRPIKDKAIDALVIATPHKEHASQILSGLENNKSIFVEKPICISFQELNQIKKALSLPTKSFICADFNRSHSPMVQKIKSLSENRLTPMLINYKVNAGFLPKHSWINEAENGSRVLGEACHFFELFIFLIDSKIKTISVSSTCSEKTLGENFTATLGFFDGSQASLSYISLGNENLAKERGEFSWEGKSALLDDFYELKTFGFKKTEAIKHQIKDKGHKSLIHLYFDSLKKNERTVIDMLFRRQIRATEISLYVDQMVRQGGGFLEFEQEAKQPNTNTNAYIKEKSEIGHCAD